jgi:pimeloyl-ACP methyl ester carboxylesterase
MADDVIGLMDHLGIKKAHILGISMGGMIAQQIAIHYPERINKLILGCTFASSSDPSGWSPEFLKALGIGDGETDDDSRSMNVREIAGLAASFTFNTTY